ncbi:MAG TPA: hypothetical protein PKB10_12590, partial [Tepidisphaeraceae bacterium]|nr:hypothetical protein [Tepidisphaeraceae bacterium]
MSPNAPAAPSPPSDTPCSDPATQTTSDHPHRAPAAGFDRPTLTVQLVNLAAVVFPLAGVVAAGVLTWGWGFDWMPLILLVTFYLLTAIGVTVGMHQYFPHPSFETTRPVQVILALLGMMSIEGPLLRWVATHRKHHQHSDEEHDPHSPHLHGHGLRGFFHGLWHAHMGWLFDPDARGMDRYVGDLKKDPLITRLSSLFPLWAILSLVLPGIIGGLLWVSWQV